jgi:hypothetical protein
MTLITNSKTKFSIGTTTAATDIASFSADTYTDIGLVENFGAIGDKAEVIQFTSLSDGRVQKVAGIRDAGEFDLTVGFDPNDAGQNDLDDAFAAATPYNFRVELNNALTTGAGPHHGTRFYFRGLVTAAENDAGAPKEVVKRKYHIAVTSGVLVSAAA